jgi:hypothetical protein
LISILPFPVITINTQSSPQVLHRFGPPAPGKTGKYAPEKLLSRQNHLQLSFGSRQNVDNFYVDGKKVNGNITKTISKDYENHVRTAQISEDVTISFRIIPVQHTGWQTSPANTTKECPAAPTTRL